MNGSGQGGAGPRRRQQAPAPFVVGVSRSGTTLVRLMLDAHPALAIPPETQFVPGLLRVMARLERKGLSDAELRRRALERITGARRWNDFGLPPDALERGLEALDPVTPGGVVRAFFGAYAELLGKPRWGSKSPGYMKSMALISRHVPEARFIHLVRDPRDVAASLRELSWGPDDVGEAAHDWVSKIEQAREQAGELPPGAYLELRYEDLIEDPAPAVRAIAEMIELDWDDAMLSYHEHADERMREVHRDVARPHGGVITAEERRRQHALLSQPPTPSRIGRWRTDLSDEERRRVESVAAPLMAELGYSPGP
jgi:hypothetical protein